MQPCMTLEPETDQEIDPMPRFDYVRATSIAHAQALLAEPDVRSRVLAGGTDLLLLLREGQTPCDRVVDITQIAELHRIHCQDGYVSIGAAATFSEIIASDVVNATAPLLVAACRSVGAPQIRNMGTLGGNVANAAACADSLPALVCLDAIAHAETADGKLHWPVSEFVTRPNRTQLPPAALLTALSYRVPPPDSRSVFLKLGRRNALAISRLTVAALGCVIDGRIAEARVVPGSATPQIHRFAETERALLGREPTAALCTEAGQTAVREMSGITGRRWSSEYKEPALAALVTRALRHVFGLAEQITGETP